MKATRLEKLTCLILGGILLAFSLGFPFAAGRDYSPLEKRRLASTPELSADSLLSGRFGEQTESFMADHLPGRDLLVGAVAYYDLLSGRQDTKEILRGRSGRLYERPVEWDAASVRGDLDALCAFAEKTGLETTLMLVPSAGSVLRDDLPGLRAEYPDAEIIALCAGGAGEGYAFIDLLGPFSGREDRYELYYSTDHHWSSLGAHEAAAAYLESRGGALRGADGYEITAVPGFRGSTCARSALWLTESEDVELWDCGGCFTVTCSENPGPHEGLFFTENLESDDMYTVFLDGNHSLVRIENADPAARGKLLVVRDSYSNCLGCFLAEGYATVVLVDLRYYKLPLSELCAEEGFDELLVVYGVGNFVKESNLVWLD